MNYSAIQLWCDPVFIRRRIIEQTKFYAEVASRPLEGEFTAKRKKWVLSAALLQLRKFQDRYDVLLKGGQVDSIVRFEILTGIPVSDCLINIDARSSWRMLWTNIKRKLILSTL